MTNHTENNNNVVAESPRDEKKEALIEQYKNEVIAAVQAYNFSQKNLVRALINLKSVMTDDKFKLFVVDLDLCASTVSKLRTILNNETIKKNIEILPHSYASLYLLASKLEEKDIQMYLDNNKLSRSSTRKDVMNIINSDSLSGDSPESPDSDKESKKKNYQTGNLMFLFDESLHSAFEPKTKDIETLAKHFTEEALATFTKELSEITGFSVDIKNIEILLGVVASEESKEAA
jgi:hypothetical protein